MLLCFFLLQFSVTRACVRTTAATTASSATRTTSITFLPKYYTTGTSRSTLVRATNVSNVSIYFLFTSYMYVLNMRQTFASDIKPEKHVQLQLPGLAHSSCVMHKHRAVLCDLVCQSNLVLLRQFEDVHLVSVTSVNPRLYDHVKEMQEAKVDPWRCCSTCMCM